MLTFYVKLEIVFVIVMIPRMPAIFVKVSMCYDMAMHKNINS